MAEDKVRVELEMTVRREVGESVVEIAAAISMNTSTARE